MLILWLIQMFRVDSKVNMGPYNEYHTVVQFENPTEVCGIQPTSIVVFELQS